MRVTRRDWAVAALAVAIGWPAMALVAASPAAVLGPAVFRLEDSPATRNPTGEVRQLVKRPTATLRELEMHVTTLNAGATSHAPHRHPNEELVIIDSGTVETLSGGVWWRAGPGAVIFNASNSLHGLRNVGEGPATYHVVNWTSADTPTS